MVPFWTSYHSPSAKSTREYCSQESQGSCGPPVKKQLEVRCLSMLADIVSLFLSNPCPGVDDSMLRSPCRVLGPQSALRGAIDGQQIPDRHGPVLKNYSSRVQCTVTSIATIFHPGAEEVAGLEWTCLRVCRECSNFPAHHGTSTFVSQTILVGMMSSRFRPSQLARL